MEPRKNTTGSFAALWQEAYGEKLTEEQAKLYEDRLTKIVMIALDLEPP